MVTTRTQVSIWNDYADARESYIASIADSYRKKEEGRKDFLERVNEYLTNHFPFDHDPITESEIEKLAQGETQ